MKTTGVVCCFCNKNVESDAINPCDINILSNWDKEKNKQHNQTFWCHYECFREKLHTDVQQHCIIHLLDNK